MALISHIYGSLVIPTIPIIDITPNWLGDPVNAKISFPAEVTSVTRIRSATPRNGVIITHLVYPSAPAINRLIVTISGHEAGGYTALCGPLIQPLLQQGYHILGVDMPVYGNNGGGVGQNFNRLNGSLVTINFSHDFTALANDGASPLRFFLDGTIGGINTALQILGFPHYDTSGISGGGWTIDFLSAIDPRCRRSYPVFGSLPFYLRPPGAAGDYEQFVQPWWMPGVFGGNTLAGLFNSGFSGASSGGYLSLGQGWATLYALGCLDLGRKRSQVLGLQDPTFPIATILPEIAALEAQVNALVPPGNHVIHIDTTVLPPHEYTAQTLAFIIGDLNANP